MHKPVERFADFYMRTRNIRWHADVIPFVAEGMVDYIEAAVGRLDAAVAEVTARQIADADALLSKPPTNPIPKGSEDGTIIEMDAVG